MNTSFQEVLKKRAIPYRTGVLAADLCTFRIGGPIALLIEPQTVEQLCLAVDACERSSREYAVIGNGSNILFADGEIRTVLIRTVAVRGIESLGNDRIYAECGVSLGRVCALAASCGLSGLEFACGIPGTVGGAAFMNAGAHGECVMSIVEQVTAYDCTERRQKTLFNQKWGEIYRNSVFKSKNMIILSAIFGFHRRDEQALIRSRMQDLRRIRRGSQPTDRPSAGSVFKRPAPDIPLSKIIDELGLKGARVGGAVVSQKHAGFIVNEGGASALEVRALIEHIQNVVEREKGFRPEPEIRFIPEEV